MIDPRIQQAQADRLKRMLVTKDAFLPFFKGLFSGAKVTDAWKVYTQAEENGVHINYKLRTIEASGQKCTMYAFWTTDEPTVEELTFLKSKALEVSPGLMRAESAPYKTFQEWTNISQDMSRIQTALGDKEKRRYVYVVSGTDDEMPLVIFSRRGHIVSLLPVRNHIVHALGLDHAQVGIQTKL